MYTIAFSEDGFIRHADKLEYLLFERNQPGRVEKVYLKTLNGPEAMAVICYNKPGNLIKEIKTPDKFARNWTFKILP